MIHRLATLKMDIEGKFTKWKSGDIVSCCVVRGSSYCIERLRWAPTYFPLTNQCVGIPRSALDIHGLDTERDNRRKRDEELFRRAMHRRAKKIPGPKP